jgi:hypothetical protein
LLLIKNSSINLELLELKADQLHQMHQPQVCQKLELELHLLQVILHHLINDLQIHTIDHHQIHMAESNLLATIHTHMLERMD